jgi:peptidoglycan/xylan/chitin deacetylase (PgdA/CDA1 family)
MFLKLLFCISNCLCVIQNCINDKEISITFDDGISENTKQIIDILKQNKVTATFFINGINVIKRDGWDLVRELISNGNIIATHTFSHASLSKLNDFNIRRELYDNEMIFRILLNKRPNFFRPPYFDYNDYILGIVKEFGYETVVVSLDTYDWNGLTETQIYNAFVNSMNNSTSSFISLNHEQVKASVLVLDKIIKYIKTLNYKIVSLEECTGKPAYRDDVFYGPILTNGLKNYLTNF